ncbi:DUF2905 family protein [Niveibacterium sp. SC-1]|uniref:DUF2905 family protein n=1 Tax=Niveibacterium sp. SC-1 TaxID=3135646 RepID=UPI00311DE809
MIKWLIVVVLLAIVAGFLDPMLRQRLGGRLPGDVDLRLGRRKLRIALGMTVLLSVLAGLILRRL